MVEHVEVLVEEPSMEAALRSLLPKILGELAFEVYPHQCKAEMLARLPQRLRGYVHRRRSDVWFRDHCRIVVVIDRDDRDCVSLKRELEDMGHPWGDVGGIRTRASEGRLFHGRASEDRSSRAVALHLDPWRSTSPSFCSFRDVMLEMAGS